MPSPPKAVALVSGGLDSMLAVRLLLDQGVHVEGLNFFTGFCVEGHTHAIRNHDRRKIKRNNALWAAEQLGIKLHIIDVIEQYKGILTNPRHGYGANLNPCLDCKSFMVGKAREWMESQAFDFVITGEVIGQRPMSQRRDTFPVIARESGADDLLLRPLSARLLVPTRPEREGWVDRTRLLGLNGRSRKPQIELAAQFGYHDYAQPAGGCCFLTDESYTGKLRDMWQQRGHKGYDIDDIMLLKVGRHLRPDEGFKMIIARDAGESRYLQGYRKRFTHLNPVSHPGPLTLIDGEASDAGLHLAARVSARFGQGREAPTVQVQIVVNDGNTRTVAVTPMAAGDIPSSWYI